MDLELLSERLDAAGEPRFRAAQVWAWTARGVTGYEAMTDLPVALRARLADEVPFSSLTPRGRGARPRRHGQGAVPHPRRASRRGRAHALPRPAPLAVPVLAVGLPADLQLLRHRADEVRAQPHGGRDPRPGAALPPHRRGRPRRVHGDGRADDEPRQRPRVLRAPAGPGHHPSPDGDLHGRLDPGHRRARRAADADPPRALRPRRRRGAALGDHAGQRPLSARRRARRLPSASTRPSAA